MISADAISALESDENNLFYILGARMRRDKEIREQVLSRPGRYTEVREERKWSKDPSPLRVKQVEETGRRYIVCENPCQARKEAAEREAIISDLKGKLKQGPKSLIGNKGYRKYLKVEKDSGM